MKTVADFETIVLEKLDSLEARFASIDRQMTVIVNSFRRLGMEVAEIKADCITKHADTPLPMGYKGNGK